MNSSNSGLTFIDLGAPTPLTHTFDFYPEEGYNHSGWLSDNGTTYVFADETPGKSVKVCDFSDWTDPQITALIKPNTLRIPNSLFRSNETIHMVALKLKIETKTMNIIINLMGIS